MPRSYYDKLSFGQPKIPRSFFSGALKGGSSKRPRYGSAGGTRRYGVGKGGLVVELDVDSRRFQSQVRNVQLLPQNFLRVAGKRIAREIRDGRTKWPVDTGLSKRSFYYADNAIRNDIPYAYWVEHKHKRAPFIRPYVARRLPEIAQDLLEFVTDDGSDDAPRGAQSFLGELFRDGGGVSGPGRARRFKKAYSFLRRGF